MKPNKMKQAIDDIEAGVEDELLKSRYGLNPASIKMMKEDLAKIRAAEKETKSD